MRKNDVAIAIIGHEKEVMVLDSTQRWAITEMLG